MNQQKPGMIVPALIGGAFLGISSALPLIEFLNCACCVLIIGGGMIASYLHIKDLPVHLGRLEYGDAAILGLLTGVIGALIWTAIDVPIEILKAQIGLGLGGAESLEELLNDPEIPPAARRLARQLLAGGIGVGLFIVSFITNLVFSLIFATIGSIIGAAVFQKSPPAQPFPQQSVQPSPVDPPPPGPPPAQP